MSAAMITQLVSEIQDSKIRRSLRDQVRYKLGKKGESEAEVLAWLRSELGLKAEEVRDLKNEEIPKHKVDAVLREMQNLQTAELVSNSGVRIETQPRSYQPQAITFESQTNWAAWATALKTIFIASIVIASTYYLVSATIKVYGVMGAILFELMPLAGVLVLKDKVWKVLLALLFLGVGMGTLNSMRITKIAETEFVSLDKNPEYQRLKDSVASIQKEIDGMPANFRTKRAEKRSELKPITDRMTEIEKSAAGSTSSEASRSTANVEFVLRIMIYIGAIVLTHVLAEDIQRIQFRGMRNN